MGKDTGVSWVLSGTHYFSAKMGWEQWGTHRGEQVSRKGKAPPLERGRGKYSLPANPIGSLRKPWSEGIMGSTYNI